MAWRVTRSPMSSRRVRCSSRMVRMRGPPDGYVTEAAGDCNEQGNGADGRRGEGRQAEQRIEGEPARADQRQRDRHRAVEQRHFIAVVLGEDAVGPVNAGGHDHDREHQGRADRAEKTEGQKQTADDLADGRGRGEETPRVEADGLEEAGRPGEAVSAEPAEELLGAVGSHENAENETCNQETFIHRKLLHPAFFIATIQKVVARNSTGRRGILSVVSKIREHTPELCASFHKAIELVGRRWTGAIVFLLLKSRCRFATLRDAIPDITDPMLSDRLRELAAEGIVDRTVVP